MLETPNFDSAKSLADLHSMLDLVQFKNGWAKPTPSLYPEPKKKYIPAHWKFKDAHAALHCAGKLVSTEHAERRNLILANPIEGNDYATVSTLVGAYQMVKGGEMAKSHKHSPNAMRIILEGAPNAFTVVNGKSIPMMNGDVLLTPNGCYHGHDNQSSSEAYWIDILDVPLVQFLGPMFFQTHPNAYEEGVQFEPQSEMRFAFQDFSKTVLHQPPMTPGVRALQLGPAQLTTFDRTVIHLDANTRWTNTKTTFNQLFVVLQGSGQTQAEKYHFSWSVGDFIAVPSWYDFFHESNEECVLIKVTDLPLLKLLNFDVFNFS
jgi:gentisate 1,2-dioxygenase